MNMKNMYNVVPQRVKYQRGLITGNFDMFNVRHLDYIRRAKEWCDYLLVGIYTDEYKINDTALQSIIPFADRARIVQSVCYVDEVIPIDNNHFKSVWEAHPFDVFFEVSVKGAEPNVALFGELKTSIVTLNETITPLEVPTDHIEIQGGDIVGYTTGVFDMFHVGHLNILERAKAQCDFLIVGVSTDENVVSYKHKRPVIPFEERAAIISSICYVDAVVPQRSMDKFAAWENLRFNVMFHGDDWKGSAMFNEVEMKLKSVGCEMRFLPHTDGISTSILREKLDMK